MKRSGLEQQKEERQYGKLFKQRQRTDLLAQEREREYDKHFKQRQRTDLLAQEREREYDKHFKQRQRTDLLAREREREYDTENKRQQRSVPTFREKERENDMLRKQHTSNHVDIQQAITLFKKATEETCNYVCTCCDQLWFRNSVVKATYVTCSDVKVKEQCICGIKSFDGNQYLCHTCNESIKKGKIPKLSVANGFRFPEKQPVLELNKLEERLVSPVTVFMQIRELPSGQQQSVHGNVVNVPCDNIATLTSLPRLPDNTDTIPLKLKRRLRYKSYVLYENVRLHACIEAVCYLLRKPLYQKYVPDGVNNEWMDKYDQQIENMQSNTDRNASEELQQDVLMGSNEGENSSERKPFAKDKRQVPKPDINSLHTEAGNKDTDDKIPEHDTQFHQNDTMENEKDTLEDDNTTQDSDWSEDENDDNNKPLEVQTLSYILLALMSMMANTVTLSHQQREMYLSQFFKRI